MKRYITLIISVCLVAYPVVGLFLALPTGEGDYQQSFGLKQVIYVVILIIGVWLLISSLKKILNKPE
jgi:hypothetical protein